jgi:hypothetical protein
VPWDCQRREAEVVHAALDDALDMDRITVTKIALALAGVGMFAYGVRSEDTVVRWIGIGLVVIAFLLRFFKTTKPE